MVGVGGGVGGSHEIMGKVLSHLSHLCVCV